MPVSRRALAVAVAGRLVGVTNATGYFGQIGAKSKLPGGPDVPATPPPKSATDNRVAPYFIVEPGIGRPGTDDGPEPSVAGSADPFVDLNQLLTIRAAAGDVEDLLALVDRIDARLRQWTPVVAGVRCGFLTPPPGYDPPLLTDQTVQPARLFAPLQYRLTAHT